MDCVVYGVSKSRAQPGDFRFHSSRPDAFWVMENNVFPWQPVPPGSEAFGWLKTWVPRMAGEQGLREAGREGTLEGHCPFSSWSRERKATIPGPSGPLPAPSLPWCPPGGAPLRSPTERAGTHPLFSYSPSVWLCTHSFIFKNLVLGCQSLAGPRGAWAAWVLGGDGEAVVERAEASEEMLGRVVVQGGPRPSWGPRRASLSRRARADPADVAKENGGVTGIISSHFSRLSYWGNPSSSWGVLS